MTLIDEHGNCTSCGHGILAHQRGICQVLITRRSQIVLGGIVVMACNCTAILPPGTHQQLPLDIEPSAQGDGDPREPEQT